MSVRAVSCCRVSVAVRSLREFENSVSVALLVAPTTYPMQQQSYFFSGLVCYFAKIFKFKRLSTKIIYLISNINNVMFFAYHFPKKSITTTRNCRLFAGCSALGLFGLSYTVAYRCVCTCFGGCHKWYDFGQVGEKDGHAGVIDKICRFAGAYPPTMWSIGGIPKTHAAPRSR